jgi:hypothetical protein
MPSMYTLMRNKKLQYAPSILQAANDESNRQQTKTKSIRRFDRKPLSGINEICRSLILYCM